MGNNTSTDPHEAATVVDGVTAVTIDTPAELVPWIRKRVRDALGSKGDGDLFPPADELTREDVAEAQLGMEMYIALLDQLGWADNASCPERVEVDRDLAVEVLDNLISWLGEDMMVACGEYPAHPYSAPKVLAVARQALWLVDVRAGVEAQLSADEPCKTAEAVR